MIGFYVTNSSKKGDQEIYLAVPFIGTKNEVIYNKGIFIIDSEMFLTYRETGNPINKIILNTIESGNETGSLPTSGYEFYLEVNIIYPSYTKEQKKELMNNLHHKSKFKRNFMFLYTNDNVKEKFLFSINSETGEIQNRELQILEEN